MLSPFEGLRKNQYTLKWDYGDVLPEHPSFIHVDEFIITYRGWMEKVIADSQSKNAVCVFKITRRVRFLPWKITEKISRRSMLFHTNRKYYQTYGSGFTRNVTLNGSIYYV